MSPTPRVTILMAVHNGGPHLDAAVRSVLAQTFADFELLIVDDASTDASREQIGRFQDARIRLIRNEMKLGLARSLNKGLALATAELIARHDADDVSHPDRVSEQVAFLERHPQVAVLGTQARFIDADGRPVRRSFWPKSTSYGGIRWQLMFDSPFVHASVMFRRSVIWSRLAGYDETFDTSQDFELWTRAMVAGCEMRNLPSTLIDFRLHDQSASARYRREHVEKLHGVLLGILEHVLGSDAVPSGWPDAWIRLNNPRVFDAIPGDAMTCARAIATILRAFRERYPEAACSSEVRRHAAAMLVRIASAGARRAAWADASRVMRMALRMNPAVAAGGLPICLASAVRGERAPRR